VCHGEGRRLGVGQVGGRPPPRQHSPSPPCGRLRARPRHGRGRRVVPGLRPRGRWGRRERSRSPSGPSTSNRR